MKITFNKLTFFFLFFAVFSCSEQSNQKEKPASTYAKKTLDFDTTDYSLKKLDNLFERKILPKNFDKLIKANNIDDLKNVFKTCELDARGGYGNVTALSFYNIPDELVRWLVESGADIEAVDNYGRTALHQHAMTRNGDIATLLELGANINATDTYGDTPLHFAAGSGFNTLLVKQLVDNGAETNVLNSSKQTPLERALSRANNTDLINLVKISEILLPNAQGVNQKMKDDVSRIGENFEFHRENFNEDLLQETDKALTKLYKLFDVQPVKRRIQHDGTSPIIVHETSWQKQFEELWDLLIPSCGSAKTVQGEVVRIAGKVRDEIYRNGGGNWNIQFKKMLDAFILHINSHNSLSISDIDRANSVIQDLRKNGDAETNDLNFLCEIATRWVLMNTNPILLEKPEYKI